MNKTIIITTFLILFLVPTCFAQEYDIVDLGIGAAYDINNNGQVVGGSYGGYYNELPFLWSNNQRTVISNYYGAATAINNYGEIVGYADNQGTETAFHWNNSFSFLSTNSSRANDINDNSIIVGQINNGSFQDAGYWENSSFNIIYTGSESFFPLAGAINKWNVVAGGWTNLGGGPIHGGYATDIDNGYNVTYSNVVADINDFNQVVGFGFIGQDGIEEGVPEWMGTFYGIGINNLGDAVGFMPEEGAAAIYQDGWLKDLNDLIPQGSSWDLEDARAINDYGQIVGYGTFNGETHAFLLNPIPEPSTILMFLFGIFGIFGLKKKK